MKRRGNGVNLSSALDNVVGRLDRKGGGGYQSVKVAKAWERIAGPLVLSHTTGAHLKGDRLVVYVDGAAWATELAAMAEQYRVSLNADLGQDRVSAVSFTVSRRVAEEHRIRSTEEEAAASYSEDQVDPVPLSEGERAQVEASAAMIPDEELREAAIRATVRDMEWKRGISARNARQAPRDDA